MIFIYIFQAPGNNSASTLLALNTGISIKQGNQIPLLLEMDPAKEVGQKSPLGKNGLKCPNI